MSEQVHPYCRCLYYAANALARNISRLARSSAALWCGDPRNPFTSPSLFCCVLTEPRLGYKKSEMPNQVGFSFQKSPTQSLRAVNATVNGSARDLNIQFFPNWRVPLTSVVTKVFNEGGYDERDEDLAWWTASGGKCLGSFPTLGIRCAWQVNWSCDPTTSTCATSRGIQSPESTSSSPAPRRRWPKAR